MSMTPEQLQKYMDANAQNKTLTEIAKELSMSKKSLYTLCSEWGINTHRKAGRPKKLPILPKKHK